MSILFFFFFFFLSSVSATGLSPLWVVAGGDAGRHVDIRLLLICVGLLWRILCHVVVCTLQWGGGRKTYVDEL